MECHIPLIEMTKELSVDGAKTAKNLYGSRGWIAHHNADIWRSTSPVDGTGLWAIYQVGSAWLCHHLWEQFEYNQDLEYLKEVYPYLHDAALFYIDNLQRDEDGYLVTNPSESFENHFKKPDGKTGWACVGATQDMQIIRDLFRNTIKASEILNMNSEIVTTLVGFERELLPMRISPTTGRLQEWKDDWQAASPHGGQVAHGWGLAVGNQISPLETPELAKAFQKTIEHRRPWESYNCGSWVGSFAAKFWARLWDGNMTQTVLSTHIQKAVSPNMTANFQGNFWEIDGNLGITASIAEMFLQSHTGEIVLLPALPSAYPEGSVQGLRARGGFVVNMAWENGVLLEATIEATVDSHCVLRYKDMSRDLSFKKGDRKLIQNDLSMSPLPKVPTI
jgi:alpha-L-fucosidase 2